MENATSGGWTDHTKFIEYKVSVVMWKVVPPLILVLGTFGNLATILVMGRIKDNNSSQYAILMVLAMADLCVLYSGLFTLWLREAYHVFLSDIHTVLCKLFYWAVYASNTMSAWLVTTVTVQRTMAVLWPHRMRMLCTVRRTNVVVVAVIVTAWSAHLHMLFGFHLTEKDDCYTSGNYELFYIFIWLWVDMCISSLLPSTCLLVCSVILSWTLFKSTSLSAMTVHSTSTINTGHSHDDRKSSAMKVTVMILALSCTFLILTLPVCIYDVWNEYQHAYTPKMEAVSFAFLTLTYFMWFSNSAVNFLLYCLTGTRFRKEFMSLLLCGAKNYTVGETTAVTSIGGGSKRQNSTPLSA